MFTLWYVSLLLSMVGKIAVYCSCSHNSVNSEMKTPLLFLSSFICKFFCCFFGSVLMLDGVVFFCVKNQLHRIDCRQQAWHTRKSPTRPKIKSITSKNVRMWRAVEFVGNVVTSLLLQVGCIDSGKIEFQPHRSSLLTQKSPGHFHHQPHVGILKAAIFNPIKAVLSLRGVQGTLNRSPYSLSCTSCSQPCDPLQLTGFVLDIMSIVAQAFVPVGPWWLLYSTDIPTSPFASDMLASL